MTIPGLDSLTQAIREARPGQILFVTGAGVSLASGIPTFRGSDPNAIWKRDVMEMATLRFFRQEPATSWQWYLARFESVAGARPNRGHHAIAALERFQLERGGDFLLVTQNIDTLHEQAGSRRMVKVHGSSDRFRCAKDGCEHGAPTGSIPASQVDLSEFRARPVLENVPRCRACGGLLRMHVLWFDEYYTGHRDYGWEKVVDAAERAELVVFAGTSFAVGVTELVLHDALARGVPVFNVDPSPRIDAPGVTSVPAGSEVALVEVCSRIGIAL